MRGAIPGREPHLFRKKRAEKIPRKRWKQIKTHNENAMKNIIAYKEMKKQKNEKELKEKEDEVNGIVKKKDKRGNKSIGKLPMPERKSFIGRKVTMTKISANSKSKLNSKTMKASRQAEKIINGPSHEGYNPSYIVKWKGFRNPTWETYSNLVEMMGGCKYVDQFIHGYKNACKNQRSAKSLADVKAYATRAYQQRKEQVNEEMSLLKQKRMAGLIKGKAKKRRKLRTTTNTNNDNTSNNEVEVKQLTQRNKELEQEKQSLQEDLEDTNETLSMQLRATDIWQGKFDEVYTMAKTAGVDIVLLNEIRDRALTNA